MSARAAYSRAVQNGREKAGLNSVARARKHEIRREETARLQRESEEMLRQQLRSSGDADSMSSVSLTDEDESEISQANFDDDGVDSYEIVGNVEYVSDGESGDFTLESDSDSENDIAMVAIRTKVSTGPDLGFSRKPRSTSAASLREAAELGFIPHRKPWTDNSKARKARTHSKSPKYSKPPESVGGKTEARGRSTSRQSVRSASNSSSRSVKSNAKRYVSKPYSKERSLSRSSSRGVMLNNKEYFSKPRRHERSLSSTRSVKSEAKSHREHRRVERSLSRASAESRRSNSSSSTRKSRTLSRSSARSSGSLSRASAQGSRSESKSRSSSRSHHSSSQHSAKVAASPSPQRGKRGEDVNRGRAATAQRKDSKVDGRQNGRRDGSGSRPRRSSSVHSGSKPVSRDLRSNSTNSRKSRSMSTSKNSKANSKGSKSSSRSDKSSKEKDKRRRKKNSKRVSGGRSNLHMCGTLLVRTAILAIIAAIASKHLFGSTDLDGILSDAIPWPTNTFKFVPHHNWVPAEVSLAQDISFNDARTQFLPAAPFDVATQSPGSEIFTQGIMAIDSTGSRLVVAGGGNLAGYFADNLRTLWNAPLVDADRPRALSRLQIHGEISMFPGSCRSVDSFRVADGVSTWSLSMPEGVDACRIVDIAPAAEGKCYVVLTLDGDLLGIDPETGVLCAPHRRLACPQSLTGGGCVQSQRLAALGRNLYVKASAMLNPSSPDGSDALYEVNLIDADADIRQPFMFRVSKAKALAKSTADPFGPALVHAALDGQQVVVLHGCQIYGLQPETLADLWTMDLCTRDNRPLLYIEGGADGSEVVISDDNTIHRLSLSPRGRSPVMTWKSKLRDLFPKLHHLEEARVLSRPVVRDNGILVRVGTSRGIARVPIQAGLALLDKNSGVARWFTASTQLSQGNLVVDIEGAVISFADGSHQRAEEYIGIELLNDGAGRRAASARTGMQRVGCSDWKQSEAEITRYAKLRGALASTCSSAGWFGRGIKNEAGAKMNLVMATQFASQAARAAERAGMGQKSSFLHSIAEQVRLTTDGFRELENLERAAIMLQQINQ